MHGKKMICCLLAALALLPALSACRDPIPTDSPKKTTGSAGTESEPSSGQYGEGDDVVISPYEYKDLGYTDHAALSRAAAAEGMVLLENKEQALPLPKDSRTAIFGKGQIEFCKGGTGSGNVNAPYTVNLLDGMRQKEKEGKTHVLESLASAYEANPSYLPSEREVKDAARQADTALFVVTRNTGEMYDRKAVAGDYMLSAAEKALLEQIASAGFARVIVVLNVPAVQDTSFMREIEGISALLVCWQPGMEGGNAVADVLTGDVNPSGKLADTFASAYTDYPSSRSFNRRQGFEEYTEDIFVGYRYFETFDPDGKKVAYPFGFGLSYTTFSFENTSARCDGVNLLIKTTVRNTGTVPGKEVAQAYYSAPQGKLGNPSVELAAYAKTDLLQPGESEELELSFALSDMASYDDLGKIAVSAYVLERGEYRVYVGNSVRDARARDAVYVHKQTEDRITQQLEARLAPTQLSKRLTADGSYEALPTPTPALPLTDVTVIQAHEGVCATAYSVAAGTYRGIVAAGISPFSAGSVLKYTIDCPEEGDYRFVLYAGAPGSETLQNAFTLTCGETSESAGFTCSGSLYALNASQTVTLRLKRGVNVLSVKNAGLSKSNLFSHIVVYRPGIEQEGEVLVTRESYPSVQKTVSSFLKVYDDPSLLDDFINGLTIDELVNLLEGHGATVAGGTGTIGTSSGLDVPGLNTADGPAGLRLSKPQTAWPIGTLLACTFNKDLVYTVGRAVAEEMLENGVDLWLAPGMNIHRDPLCGRNFEYYSEDPLLTGLTASALVQGVQSKGVGAMIKHFALNNRETNRKGNDSRCSERAAREIYLKGFELAVKNAAPMAIMSSYVKINGVYASENADLLTGILRGEWGYEGFVSTDWENTADKFREPGAGNDVSMPNGNAAQVKAALALGLCTAQQLRESAGRILKAVLNSPAMKRLADPPAKTVPGDGSVLRVKAVDWVKKADRIGSEICEDEDGGYNPKFTEVNGFLTYRVEVLKAGNYTFSFRLASPNGAGAFDLFIDGKRTGHFKMGKSTGGWQSWDTFADVLKAEISEGKHEIKIVFTAEQININYWEMRLTEE